MPLHGKTVDSIPTVRKRKKTIELAPVCTVESVKEKGRAMGEGGGEPNHQKDSNGVSKRGLPSVSSRLLTRAVAGSLA